MAPATAPLLDSTSGALSATWIFVSMFVSLLSEGDTGRPRWWVTQLWEEWKT